ncbi:Glycosyltransferase involved in cell wall bisynthesis [Mucilaginibacter pineti]|uniref:Glycosyltransferase involved in cell wall bisynthesis n=1 Tax=Mucilaginibacter pineti TaxID=1391627 RepID=A0A1G6ZP22_9SPHI|nr:glycosyltransferase [Mucilaginibacter pineti]SDE03957.1 Glycosyltransferase involved in cell wall bisynthesis [Mucilaginibacter pineti]
MNKTGLFISDENYLNQNNTGGVQLCTREYLEYLRQAGIQIQEYPVRPVINVFNRVKIKLGLDTYDHYSASPYLGELIKTINESGIKLVFFNQINLSPWAKQLKRYVAADVKFIGLSHGNESADYLNDITRQGKAGFLKAWRLGKLLVREHKFFTLALDGVVILSAQEVAINQWLGAQETFYLPRLLTPGFMETMPSPGVAGFVGTLDHLPNKLGIVYLADELTKLDFSGTIQLVGGPAYVGMELAHRYSFIKYKGQLDNARLNDEITGWSLFLNPVFWYARGASTKLAQAINLGIPCLTTTAGRRGYELSDENIVVQGNKPRDFALAIVSALSNEAMLKRLGASSRHNALHFDSGKYADQLAGFLDQLSAK